MTYLTAVTGALAAIPLDPDADDAREQVVRELTNPEYAAARPNFFQQAVTAFFDWLSTLTVSDSGAPSSLVTVIVVVLIAAVVIVAFLVFGVPRLNRRSVAAGALFGDQDDRTAAALREAAEQSAANGDYASAIADMFRSLARGLSDRTLVVTTPGTTAHNFAAQAAVAFPDRSPSLITAAASFDRVRYLGGDGSAAEYATVEELERQLRAARPALEAVDA